MDLSSRGVEVVGAAGRAACGSESVGGDRALVADRVEHVQLPCSPGGEPGGDQCGERCDGHDPDDVGDRNGGGDPESVLGERRDDPPAEHHADGYTEHCAEQRDQGGFPADHAPGLTTGHPHRPQKPDLTGSFMDRQRQRVRNTDQRNDHRQCKQGIHHDQQLVDRVLELLLELRRGLDPELGVASLNLGHARTGGGIDFGQPAASH